MLACMLQLFPWKRLSQLSTDSKQNREPNPNPSPLKPCKCTHILGNSGGLDSSRSGKCMKCYKGFFPCKLRSQKTLLGLPDVPGTFMHIPRPTHDGCVNRGTPLRSV